MSILCVSTLGTLGDEGASEGCGKGRWALEAIDIGIWDHKCE